MGLLFEEIDFQTTTIGDISLRRRRIPALGDEDIYEVKLNDEFLMSSLFVEAEVALATIGLEELAGDKLEIVVGGLGLGYTAQAALRDQRVGELLVIEALDPVIRWHNEGKVPMGKVIAKDPRCRFIHGSFFDLALGAGFDPKQPGRRFHGIFLDIDHSPRDHLSDDNQHFYRPANLARMAQQLLPDGVFTLWSNDPPDKAFMADLSEVFASVRSEVVSFTNPFLDEPASNTVYVAKARR